MRLLTNLLFEPKGMHNQNAAYSIKDTVMSGDGSKVYFAIQDVPAGIPLNDSNYWKLQIDLSGSKSAMDQALASFADYAKVIGMRVRGETAKASGNPVTFLPDAGSLLQPVTVLEPQQQGSGDPSPSNIRPFIGYDKLRLNAAGKNLCNPDEFTQGDLSEGRYLTNSVETNNVSGYVPVSPNTTYTRSSNCVSGSKEIAFYDANKIYLSRTFGETFTTPSNCYFVRLEWESTYPLAESWFQLEIGSTPSAYEPHQGKFHTVQIGQAVYGFRYNWLTGKGLIDWAILTLTGKEVIERNSGWVTGAYFIGGILSNAVPIDGYHTVAEIVCSHGVTKTPDNIANGQIGIGQGSISNLYLNFGTQYNTEESFKTLLAAQYAAGTPVQITYKLATPIEIQLTPHIISAADPEQTNTLCGDGRIETEYVKPLHVSIGGGSGGGSAPVQSVNGKTGDVQLTAADVGAASKDDVDKLSEEIESLKTPETEVTVSTTGDMIVINPGAGNEIAVTGNTDADEVKIVHCGDNLIDISSAKNIAGESVYDNGWIVIKRSEADAETSSYAQCLIPLTPAMQPGKKYNLYVEISDDTNCVGVWTLATGQKNAAEALNTQVGGLSYNNGAGVYVAPVQTKDAFSSSVVYAMRHIITWQAGAHGTIKYRPWYTVADPETVIPDGNSPFSTSTVKYAEYNGAIYTKMLPAGHSGAYQFDDLTAFAGNNTIIVSNGTVTASYSEVVSDDRVGNPLYRKRIAVLGDSISTINYTRPNYWEMIAEKTGCLFDNYATSSSRFANVEGDAVESFVERIERMDDTADAVLVMGGTNDAGRETILGTWNSNDESTFYGAMNTVILLLRTKYPGKPIVFCTPIRRNTVYDSADIFPITLSDLKQADETKPISMKQVALAIKAKCSSNGIPVIDLFDYSGIGYGCTEYFRENDILHPSAKGHVRIANMVHAELEKQFMHPLN